MNIQTLLRLTAERRASDLHLAAGAPAALRVDGRLILIDEAVVDHHRMEQMLNDLHLTEAQRMRFAEEKDLDFSIDLDDDHRFRVNLFRHRGGIGAVFRRIPTKIVDLDDLGMPPALKDLCRKDRGLILVTGPTGSGKSTTLAAMVDVMNQTRHDHIITIEDPVEFVHRSKGCRVTQREVGAHATSFAAALRAALREDPDIILVGEMRDLETISGALTAAETGHLVLATLHTNSAAQTVNRIIDAFPTDQQAQIRVQLSETLLGVLAQTLIPLAGGSGRVAAVEFLMATPAVRNLIREGKTFQIPSIIQTGARDGMVTLEQSLRRLGETGQISGDEARKRGAERVAAPVGGDTDLRPTGFGLPGTR